MSRFALRNCFLLLAPVVAVAQTPTITAILPAPNARAAARTGPVTVTFSQPLTAGSAAALKVYSAQRGGLRTREATPAVVSGNTLTFTPGAQRFMPGELVSGTVTTAATSSSGPLARPRVMQFTTAVGGTGRGDFQPGSDFTVASQGRDVATADVDGDGDLDLLATTFDGGVSIRLNGGDASGSNTGWFSDGQNVPVGPFPHDLAVGDVDGDGDLDLLTVNTTTNDVSVRLNGGDATGSNTGRFSGGQTVPVGPYPIGITLGDVDGDGDLDFLTAIHNSATVSVRLNGGDASGSNTGQFSGEQNVPVGQGPIDVAVGDVDGDGDLDVVASAAITDDVTVRLNGGDASGSNTGRFSAGYSVAVGDFPEDVVLGDGDLDMAVGSIGDNSVHVRLNGGDASGSNTGRFSGGQALLVTFPLGLTLGDVDADGDLDLLATNGSGVGVSVRLNGGDASGSNTGRFSAGRNVAVGSSPVSVAVGDLDGDGDLDLLTANEGSATVSVRLNDGTGPLAARPRAGQPLFALTPNPAQHTVRAAGLTPNRPVQVLDALGRVVLGGSADASGTTQLPLVGLKTGVYVVRCGGQATRLVVE